MKSKLLLGCIMAGYLAGTNAVAQPAPVEGREHMIVEPIDLNAPSTKKIRHKRNTEQEAKLTELTTQTVILQERATELQTQLDQMTSTQRTQGEQLSSFDTLIRSSAEEELKQTQQMLGLAQGVEKRGKDLDALQQYMTGLQGDKGLAFVRELGTTLLPRMQAGNKKQADYCAQAVTAFTAQATQRKDYLTKLTQLNEQLLALPGDTTLNPVQKTQKMVELRRKLLEAEQQHAGKKNHLETLAQRCGEEQRQYDTALAQVREHILGRVAYGLDPRRWSAEFQAGYLNVAGAHTATLGADLCWVGRKGRLCAGVEAVGGEAREVESSLAGQPTVSSSGDYQVRSSTSGEVMEATRYSLGAGLEAFTKPVGKGAVTAALGAGVTVYRGLRETTTQRTRSNQLLDQNGNPLGEEQSVSDERTTLETAVYSVVPKVGAEVCVKGRVCLDGYLGADPKTEDVFAGGGLRVRF